MAGKIPWADECVQLAEWSREYFRDAYWWDSYWIVFNEADEVAEQIHQGILEFAVPNDADAVTEGDASTLALLRKTASHMINSSGEIKTATSRLAGWTGTAATEVTDYIVAVDTSHQHLQRIVDALFIAADAYDNVLRAMRKDLRELIRTAKNAVEDGDDISVDVGVAVVAAVAGTATAGLSAGGAAIVSSVLKDGAADIVNKVVFERDGVYASEELVVQLRDLKEKAVGQVKKICKVLDAIFAELANTEIPAVVELPSVAVAKAFDASQFTLDEPDYRREVDEGKISDEPLVEAGSVARKGDPDRRPSGGQPV